MDDGRKAPVDRGRQNRARAEGRHRPRASRTWALRNRLHVVAAFALLLVTTLIGAASGPALAQTQQAMPEGIEMGRWIVAPYLFNGLSYDTNIFRNQLSPQEDGQAESQFGILSYLLKNEIWKDVK